MFKIVSEKKPRGDQPRAIKDIVKRISNGEREITLLGATGTGKTFTMANVIEKVKKPTLIISPNKTLAAQLYQELKEIFPNNAVHYFISYYDHYRPEAYKPQTDTYMPKEAAINEEIEQLRLAATSALLERDDVIIVASVSCIYGLGSPEDYKSMVLQVSVGQEIDKNDFTKRLSDMQYQKANGEIKRGRFVTSDDRIDIFLSYSKFILRLYISGNMVKSIHYINPITERVMDDVESAAIYPARHFITSGQSLRRAIESIRRELEETVTKFMDSGDLLTAERLRKRTEYDIEMLEEIGFCSGIENYSRHLLGREPGSRPYTLIDYFPKDFLTIIDESHIAIPQIEGMHAGDFSRKKTLVDFGFRLPSALDNRPLRFDEFDSLKSTTIYLSATPRKFELSRSRNTVEQIIRPTGLVDPEVIVKPTANQIRDLEIEALGEIRRGNRVLVTALTKSTAERISEYLSSRGIRSKFLHSDIDALKRTEIIRDLRLGVFDVLVGVNLLREGLDIPEAGLVAILNADKEGFLRSTTSLIQTIGRVARNVEGRAIMYADNMTESMRNAIEETERRRAIQVEHNTKNGIVPETVKRTIHDRVRIMKEIDDHQDNRHKRMIRLEEEIKGALDRLEFELASALRGRLKEAVAEMEKEAATDLIKSVSDKTKRFKKEEGIIKRKQKRVLESGLSNLGHLLKLERVERIDCIDISHFQGDAMHGGVIVYDNGKFDKSRYRSFKISSFSTVDDTRAIREVVRKHYSNVSKEEMPDLVVIDGGISQLNAAKSEFLRIKIRPQRLVSIAKREERLYIAPLNNSVTFDAKDPVKLLLQRIRDEAHRFALVSHRKARDKKILEA